MDGKFVWKCIQYEITCFIAAQRIGISSIINHWFVWLFANWIFEFNIHYTQTLLYIDYIHVEYGC